jgi:hypothetical protein
VQQIYVDGNGLAIHARNGFFLLAESIVPPFDRARFLGAEPALSGEIKTVQQIPK